MSPEQVQDLIRSQVEQLDELFEQYGDLIDSSISAEPDLVRKTALASVLHSFYTGVEGILLTVAKHVDREVPDGPRWHRDLLDRAGETNESRAAVLSAEATASLERYLAFRHFFRQAYSFILRWGDMRELVADVRGTWANTRRSIVDWLGSVPEGR